MVSDVSAVLLGHDLWHGELLRTSERFAQIGAPPLWHFAFQPSARWETARWLALPLDARVLRCRIGALTTSIGVTPAAQARCGMAPTTFTGALDALRASGYTNRYANRELVLAVGTSVRLATDLALCEIVAHWLTMLSAADRLAHDRHATSCEIFGYTGACTDCRNRWGIYATRAGEMPPFHPGCRCFVQFRYAESQR